MTYLAYLASLLIQVKGPICRYEKSQVTSKDKLEAQYKLLIQASSRNNSLQLDFIGLQTGMYRSQLELLCY